MATYIDINGTQYTNFQDLVIEDNINNEVDTAEFQIVTTIGNKPSELSPVEIQKDGKIFAGRITKVNPIKLDGTSFVYPISCSDYTIDLQSKLVVETYTDTSVHDIIEDIIITKGYTIGITTNNVINSGTIIDGIQFNYITVQQCLEKLAEITGWSWYVDYDKDLHFFPENTENAPIELTDNIITFDNLNMSYDKTQIKNRIYVRGGYYLPDSVYNQDPITATAGQTEFYIKYSPHTFTVTVDGFSKTVGIENIDAPGGHHFLLNYNEKLLKADTLTFVGGEIVAMTYYYEIPLVAMVEDITSQNLIKAIEGGSYDGIIEDVIVDDTITEIVVAQDRGKAELLKYANSLVTGSFETFTSGFRSGQRLHIHLTDRNLDHYFLIQKVTTEMIGGNQLKYTVEFATLLFGLNQLLMKLLDESRKTDIKENEVLNRLRTLYETIGTITETSVTATLITPPFEWGAGGDPQAKWNLFSWG